MGVLSERKAEEEEEEEEEEIRHDADRTIINILLHSRRLEGICLLLLRHPTMVSSSPASCPQASLASSLACCVGSSLGCS